MTYNVKLGGTRGSPLPGSLVLRFLVLSLLIIMHLIIRYLVLISLSVGHLPTVPLRIIPELVQERIGVPSTKDVVEIMKGFGDIVPVGSDKLVAKARRTNSGSSLASGKLMIGESLSI